MLFEPEYDIFRANGHLHTPVHKLNVCLGAQKNQVLSAEDDMLLLAREEMSSKMTPLSVTYQLPLI